MFLTASAQKNSLWISTGYNYGNNKIVKANDLPWGKNLAYSLGSGTSTQLWYQRQPDSSNWIAGAGLNLIIGNRNPAKIDQRPNDTLRTATLTSNSLRLCLQLGYVWQIKQFHFQLNAGLLLPVTTRVTQEIDYHDSSRTISETSVIRNNFAIGFKSNLACSYKITKNIHFFMMLDYNLLNPYVKSKKVTRYNSSNGKTLEDIYPNTADRETIYHKEPTDIKNNKDALPNAFDKTKPTDKLSYSQSYSSLGFQFGFRFLF